ncbi:histidine kinase [Streptomyces cellulosae]|jgi:signal transduction histidine kinase|uniref:histidine kinase n=1 Tax=Streptomyces thermodiastaticus TaxID=44061 RepID=A0ABU0K9C7_9ACTN|nr:two-component sensor histidine kinase [Streptomyces sp. McG7]MBT2902789.1 two-component sensor histidine kinase [Streptomyces sp. McG8]MCX4479372.1 histidine kinase [Streptomyces cellulosae]MDQ0485961.1 signal transduction histidine kinase [Streptomyces thermodiastaticus]MYW51831.1 two-component sensor histidine kinase [Streptomyces sp. SID8376]THC53737.1 two-component sensor histidine kinase [Streptomyces sp. Akac8]UVT11826.1 two-component sensor histidine kinase [Streptomyces thermocarbo
MTVRPLCPPRFDVAVALAGLLGGLLLWAFGLGVRPGDDPMVLFHGRWALLVPLGVTACCELLRRTAPRTALAVGTLALAADTVTQGSIATIVMYTDLMYAAVVYGSPATARRLPWITGVLTLAGMLVPYAVLRVPEALLIGLVVGAVTFAPASTGLIVRNHRDAADAARLQAEQTALLAEMDRVQAVTAERSRMARELHDLVANHLSAIAIHSTAALSLDDPATSKDALTVIRENSVQGLSEMRRLIGILRDGADDREPAATPTLDGLGALIDTARANGLDVALDAEHGAVPAPVELAAYRIVQESLTNALKHAAPGRVDVRLRRSPEGLEIRVTSPYGDRAGPRAPGSGAGLVGMRERAALLDGSFEAGPEDGPEGKRWVVRAALPVTDVEQGEA